MEIQYRRLSTGKPYSAPAYCYQTQKPQNVQLFVSGG